MQPLQFIKQGSFFDLTAQMRLDQLPADIDRLWRALGSRAA